MGHSLLPTRLSSFKLWASLPITIAATLSVATIGCFYIAHLILLPPIQDDSLRWGYLNKQWILALYTLGVTLVYFPSAAKRLLGTIVDRAANATKPLDVYKTSKQYSRSITTIISIGFLLAFLDIGPLISNGLVKFWDPHELVHLGPLQKIAQGAIPYFGARTQYGPGHQLISYLMMRHTQFTLLGFRASFYVLNIIAEGILFSLLLYSLGWRIGLAGIVFSRLFCPVFYLNFVGWFIEFRWIGALFVGILLPLIIWNDRVRASRLLAVIAVGVTGGALAWFSQENFSTVLVTASLIFCASFARGRYSFWTAVSLFGVFAVIHVLTFLILLTATVGTNNVEDSLYDAFHVGSLFVKGLANTPWTPWPTPESSWTVGFYLTPAIVIVLNAMGLWAPTSREHNDERTLGIFLGVAAAAASLVPITLLRSDEPHFIGPSIALPFLILLSVLFLPERLTTRTRERNLIRASLLVLLVVIYIVPQGPRQLISRLVPDLKGAWDGAVALSHISNSSTKLAGASFFEHRLGFRLVETADNPTRMRGRAGCYFIFPISCGEIAYMVDDIRSIVSNRTVFLDTPLDNSIDVSSTIYFFADLNPATSNPEVETTIWTKSDLEMLRAELKRKPPNCVISWGGELTPMLQTAFGHYTTSYVRNGFVYCRN